MEKVLGTVMEELNSVEVALLILAAYFHDQGMIVDSAEMAELRGSEDWRLHAPSPSGAISFSG
jgi:HD-GYP domain-containing protein (c-di-GMP phosphodiesterase class II)